MAAISADAIDDDDDDVKNVDDDEVVGSRRRRVIVALDRTERANTVMVMI